jgi:pyruvate kinase
MQVDNAEGIRNFDEILQGADGVMVCRGQLGVVIPPQKVRQGTWFRL